MTKFKFLGTDDSVNTCDCCGRANLKSTVALENLETSEVVHFGVTCAARAVSWGVKKVKIAVRNADLAKAEAKAQAVRAAHQIQMARWTAFLDAQVPALKGDLFRQIQALGGHAVADALYKAQG
jgi:hypothetical protein